MKKSSICSFSFAVSLLLAPAFAVAGPSASGAKKKDSAPAQSFSVYSEAKHAGNHFIPSGWMGDTSDLLYSDAETNKPRSGRSCIKVGYKGQGGSGWAGIFWQNPANNWGARANSGFDLSKYSKLTFWARGEKGGEVLSEVKVGGIKGDFPDSDEVVSRNLILSDQWTQYSIDLEGRDMSYIIGGFCVVFSKNSNPSGATVYLDDIAFVNK
jgi:hypothetical protein